MGSLVQAHPEALFLVGVSTPALPPQGTLTISTEASSSTLGAFLFPILSLTYSIRSLSSEAQMKGPTALASLSLTGSLR